MKARSSALSRAEGHQSATEIHFPAVLKIKTPQNSQFQTPDDQSTPLMGQILGKISVETPKYQLILKTPDYEIRIYPPSVLAEVTYDPSLLGGRDAGFIILANYIGAIGVPQNSLPEKIPMTAPVIIRPTPPVTMRFLLPSKYARAEDAPRPTDGRVRIREEEGERKYGVVRFGGVATEAAAAEKAEGLRRSLERDGHKVVVDDDYLLARYNPPWTLPPLRTNEVMLPIE